MDNDFAKLIVEAIDRNTEAIAGLTAAIGPSEPKTDSTATPPSRSYFCSFARCDAFPMWTNDEEYYCEVHMNHMITFKGKDFSPVKGLPRPENKNFFWRIDEVEVTP